MKFDVVVIGAGSAGYAAARSAADAGAKVAIIDKGPLGGLCILRGCMPSKTLLRSSDIMALMQRSKEFGLSAHRVTANLASINQRKKALVKEFVDYRIGELKSTRYKLIRGRARFESPNRLRVGSTVLDSRTFVIATGSVVQKVAIPGLEEVGYITSDEALDLRKLPKSMIVLGGGPTATELGQFFCRLGTKTTLIQRSAHIFSDKDEDLATPVEARLRNEGMVVHTRTKLTEFTKRGKLVTAHFHQNGKRRRASAEIIFQALGRIPNLRGLELENAGVKVNGGRIRVNGWMQTSASHIYAAGDCVGLHEIVHIAVQQGEIAGRNAAVRGREQRMNDRLRAEVVFTDPQVASVGLSEKDCQRLGLEYDAASTPFSDHGKSIILGETLGFVKLICEPKRGKLLGAHIVGPEASELIHELIAVMYFRGTVNDLLRIPHYHPTLAEILTYPAEELSSRIG